MAFSFTAASAATPTIKHTLLVSGTGLDYVGIIDTAGKTVWKHDESEAANGQKNDSWLLPNSNVIYSYQWGVRIVDIRTNKVIWDRPTPKRNNQSGETHSCQPLNDGSRFLIPECFQDTAFIVEVDTAKKEIRRIALKNQGGGTHGKWRQIRKTPQNTYLVSSYDLKHSFEYDTTGKLLHDFPAGGYVATRLSNGNTLIGTGDDCRFVEFDVNGTKIWEVNNTTASVSGLGIGFGSEAQRLANGNTVITNWGGHGSGFGAAVVEIKPDRTIVGVLPDSYPTRIASVKIIDGWKFPVRQFIIRASAGGGGSIEPAGEVAVDSITNKTFQIHADNGYSIDSVLVDGNNVGPVSTYTFNTINGNHTVKVVFEKTVRVKQIQLREVMAEPSFFVEQNGNINCKIAFEGSGYLTLYDFSGKEIIKKKVFGPVNSRLPVKLTHGVYTIIIRSTELKKEWRNSVAVEGGFIKTH